MADTATGPLPLNTRADVVAALLVVLDQLDCGDNSCLFGGRSKGGMRTNGGCRCLDGWCRQGERRVGWLLGVLAHRHREETAR